jgi:hypothetical protein
MESVLNLNLKSKVKPAVFDFFAILFIYFVPALSHLFSFPVYLFEPMRLMLILSVAHTNRTNSYIIAATLPLFSFLISSHPSIIKSAIITAELLLNVWLFFELSKVVKNKFAAMFSSILMSKGFYYFIKFILISSAVITGELFSTPIYIQIIMSLIFSLYIFWIYSVSEKNN